MRTITAVLFGILLLVLVACNKKEKQNISQDINHTADRQIIKNTQLGTSDNNHSIHSYSFSIQSSRSKPFIFSLSDKSIHTDTFNQKTIVLNIAHISSVSSLDQMESLSKLQTKYQSKIAVITFLLGDTDTLLVPNIFLNRNHIYHMVSIDKKNQKITDQLYSSIGLRIKPVPLTVIYRNGDYYSHFEGAVPVEMLDYDITQTFKNKGY